jgi:hypothetical protein
MVDMRLVSVTFDRSTLQSGESPQPEESKPETIAERREEPRARDSVKVACTWPVRKASELTLKDIHDHRIIVSSSPFYGSLDEEFRALNRVIYDVLYHRTTWARVWFLMVREASNFIYSRIKITKNQPIAKADFIYLLREARHSARAFHLFTGCSSGLSHLLLHSHSNGKTVDSIIAA